MLKKTALFLQEGFPYLASYLIFKCKVGTTFLSSDSDSRYGLIDQPQFFNLVKHQFFYFPVLLVSEGVP